MLALAKVVEVERMLAEGTLSWRKIAREVGVSRASVSAIAKGQRPSSADRMNRMSRPPDDYQTCQGPVGRCPECGARVYLPCRSCRVSKLIEQDAQRLAALRRQARIQAQHRLLEKVQAARD